MPLPSALLTVASRSLLAGLGLALLGSGQPCLARELAGWKLMNPRDHRGSQASSSANVSAYQLFNTDQESNLILKARTGANLGWNPAAPANASFRTEDGSPIVCGKPFALVLSSAGSENYRVGPEGNAIFYEPQTVGINLSDRGSLRSTDYQWKFVGCTPGASMPLNSSVTLFNTVANDSLVGCWRTLGVNLCWAGDISSIRGHNIRTADLSDAKRNYDKLK